MPNSEEPRSEPEIIQPHEQSGRPGRDQPRVHVFFDTSGAEKIYIAKPGPLGAILIILIAAMLAAVFLALLFAAFFFLLPIIVLLAAAAIIVGLLRALFWGKP